MGMDWVDRYEHIAFGTIRLGDEAMSTRRGNVVFLEDLLDEATGRARAIIDERNPGLADKDEVAEMVGIGAVLFYFLMFNRMKDISFDWAAALNYEGDSGPYVQYTYARAGSVLRRADAEVLPVAELNTGALDRTGGISSGEGVGTFRFGSRFGRSRPRTFGHSQVSA